MCVGQRGGERKDRQGVHHQLSMHDPLHGSTVVLSCVLTAASRHVDLETIRTRGACSRMSDIDTL